MKVKSVISLCTSCYIEILSSDAKKGFETYAYIDYFINRTNGIHYPSKVQIPENIQNMKVDFFIPSKIVSCTGELKDGVRIYVK